MDTEKLYATYFMHVYSYVMTLVRDSHIAEEITQDTFFKAMRTEATYRGESGEITWLCAIAKNNCIDYARKQKKTAEITQEITDDYDFGSALEDKETTFSIHLALHHLEEPYKEVFQLRIFGELSFRDIGRIFQKTESWARVTFHRARLKIQERMVKE